MAKLQSSNTFISVIKIPFKEFCWREFFAKYTYHRHLCIFAHFFQTNNNPHNCAHIHATIQTVVYVALSLMYSRRRKQFGSQKPGQTSANIFHICFLKRAKTWNRHTVQRETDRNSETQPHFNEQYETRFYGFIFYQSWKGRINFKSALYILWKSHKNVFDVFFLSISRHLPRSLVFVELILFWIAEYALKTAWAVMNA